METHGYVFNANTFENAVKDFVMTNTNKDNVFVPVLGELNRDPDRFDTILGNVSHKVISINLDDMTADIQILDTQAGKIVQKLMDMNINCLPTINATGQVFNNVDNKIEIIQIFNIDYKSSN